MATANPPSVMEFTEIPNHWKVSMVIPKLMGMAVRVMNVVRKFRRNKTKTKVTMMAASTMAFLRFPIALSMKSFCWKSTIVSRPFGRLGWSSARAAFTFPVRARVSNPCAFVSDMMTP